MSEHSKLSPSSAARWLKCPASLEGPTAEDQSSEYAAEGTVAHKLAEHCYLLGADPFEMVGLSRECDGFMFTVNDEMASAVQMLLDFVDTAREGKLVATEARIIHPSIPDFGGTVDFVIPTKHHLIDFKYGAGLVVDVTGDDEHCWNGYNAQLACYALLARAHYGWKPTVDITVTVVQPRATHQDGPIRTVVIPWNFLVRFTKEIDRVVSGERAGEFNAGDHCRFCPRRVDCPELYERTLLLAQSEFDESDMTTERASEVMQMAASIQSYLTAVQSWVHSRMEKGESVPGYKLVNRYGNRRYAFDEETIARKCRSRKFGKRAIYKMELLSPAQLEKVVGKEFIASLVERPHTGTTVVPESDRREAVQVLNAADEFSQNEKS